jgi:hypothetical protein
MAQPEPDAEAEPEAAESGAPRPTLVPKFELVLLLDGGAYEHVIPVDSQEEAEFRGSTMPFGRWEVRRYVRSPSIRVGATRRNRVEVTEVGPDVLQHRVVPASHTEDHDDNDPGPGGHNGGDGA